MHQKDTNDLTKSHESLAAAQLRMRRGRRIYARGSPVGRHATTLRKKLLPKRIPLLLRIKANWLDIVGKRYAPYCAPLKLTGGKLDKVLHIQVVSHLAVILQHEEETIRERLNNIGGGRVHRLRLHQGPLSPKGGFAERYAEPRNLRCVKVAPSQAEIAAIDHATESIKSDKLRLALERLGQTLLTHKRSDT